MNRAQFEHAIRAAAVAGERLTVRRLRRRGRVWPGRR